MLFWCLMLLVFAFLSMAIDMEKLPYFIFRHLWNCLILGLGILLFIRVKGKESQGYLEHLEYQIQDLQLRVERKRNEYIFRQLEEIDRRLRKFEEGK
jgi:hypothetical protein